MQKLKTKFMYYLGCFWLLSGCQFICPDLSIDEQNKILHYVKSEYALVFECDQNDCTDYINDKPSQGDATRTPVSKYSMSFIESPEINSRVKGREAFNIRMETKEEVLECDGYCNWDIRLLGKAYVMTIYNIGVCITTESNCEKVGQNYHFHHDKDGNSQHILTLVFRNIDEQDDADTTLYFEQPVLFYSLVHAESGLHDEIDITKHRSTHGGGVDLY